MIQPMHCTNLDEIDNVRWYSNAILFTAYLLIMLVARIIDLFDATTAGHMMAFNLILFLTFMADVALATSRIMRRAKAVLWKPLGNQQIELGRILWHEIILVAPSSTEANDEA